MMSQIPKPKTDAPNNNTKSNNKTGKVEEKNNTDHSKEEIERMINNAKDIDDLKELLVYYNLMKKKFNLEKNEEGNNETQSGDSMNSTKNEEKISTNENENKDEM
jgi:hypothetical protein